MDRSYPEPIAGALIVNDKKEIFLMKSHKWGGRNKLISGTVKLDPREGQEYVWIKPQDALKKLNLEFHTGETIKEFINRKSDFTPSYSARGLARRNTRI